MEERKQKKPSSAMETTTLTRVPESERRPWWSLAFICPAVSFVFLR